MTIRTPFEQRHIKRESGCWEWTGPYSHAGHGKYSHGKYKSEGAHRVAYRKAFGEIPEGMCVCHTCDNPSCVNPAHLWLGTQMDNMLDRDRKGRQRSPKGEAHPFAKLDWESVHKIREMCADGVSQRALSRAFAVSNQAINDIVKFRKWKPTAGGT